MRQFLLASVFMGLVASQQSFDPSLVNAAPSPSFTQAPFNVASQTLVYNSASASGTGTAAASSATAIAGQRVRRHHHQSVSSSPQSSSSSPQSSSSSPQSSSTSPTSISVGSSSSTVASASSCPTQPEAGTYCGFINPEDACAPQPDGYGPVPPGDSPASFLAYPPFHQLAQNAKTPQGYVQTYKDLNASSSANSYLGLYTLSSYDVLGCSQWCDNTTLCTAFNLYIERDPSLNPAANCTNPPSITNYKCTLWGSGLEPSTATNYGQYRDNFQVVITASDAWDKTNNTTPPPPKGCGPPTKCSGGSGIIHSPENCLGTKFFPGWFDVNICGGYALQQNTLNSQAQGQHYQQCQEINAYLVKKDGIPQGTVCALYTQPFPAEFGTYQPGWQGQHFWGIESSCVISVNQQPPQSPGQQPWWQWW